MSDIVRIGDATLYLGDCLEILPTLDKVDAVVTDPPYGIDLNTDYLTGRNQLVRKSQSNVWDKIHGDSECMDFGFLFKIAKLSIVFGANNFPQQIPFNAKKDGWIVWDKRETKAADKIVGSPFEMACVLGQRTYKFIRMQHCGVKNADGDKSGRFHPTQKPAKLMLEVLGMFPKPQSILDPFMGSGTTGVACANLGRKFIGIERERKYFDIACERIEAAYAQGRLFA